MKNIGYGTYYVSVKLADMVDSQFMVDTGSGYVAINEESLEKLKLENQVEYLRDIQGKLANGKSYVLPIWRLSSLTLNERCTLKDIEVAVFPGNTRQLLGLSALKKAAPLEISFDPPQLVLSRCDAVL
ncbi:MAG: retroviral-like aspartic protease family protein [Gammaproteobacteria bacterium]|nr:retroviral-like aspartic protease family protein [Gammaproteobacteria bacterium]